MQFVLRQHATLVVKVDASYREHAFYRNWWRRRRQIDGSDLKLRWLQQPFIIFWRFFS